MLPALKMEITDIRRLVTESVGAISGTDSVRVRLHFHPPSMDAPVDRERIRTMLVDIGTNAVEAMPHGGELAVTVTADAEKIEIVIEDSGVGIDPENMDRLFTPFFTTKPPGEGTGLGLPSAYATVKAHGGTMTVESNADPQKGPTGTNIRIALPKLPTPAGLAGRLILHED